MTISVFRWSSRGLSKCRNGHYKVKPYKSLVVGATINSSVGHQIHWIVCRKIFKSSPILTAPHHVLSDHCKYLIVTALTVLKFLHLFLRDTFVSTFNRYTRVLDQRFAMHWSIRSRLIAVSISSLRVACLLWASSLLHFDLAAIFLQNMRNKARVEIKNFFVS